MDPWFTGTLLRGLPVVFLATLVRATLFRHGTNDVNPVHVGQALPGAHPQCFLFGVRIDRFARGLTQRSQRIEMGHVLVVFNHGLFHYVNPLLRQCLRTNGFFLDCQSCIYGVRGRCARCGDCVLRQYLVSTKREINHVSINQRWSIQWLCHCFHLGTGYHWHCRMAIDLVPFWRIDSLLVFLVGHQCNILSPRPSSHD